MVPIWIYVARFVLDGNTLPRFPLSTLTPHSVLLVLFVVYLLRGHFMLPILFVQCEFREKLSQARIVVTHLMYFDFVLRSSNIGFVPALSPQMGLLARPSSGISTLPPLVI